MISIAVLGSTGSIGTQTLDIVRRFPKKFIVRALIAGSISELFKSQVNEFKPAFYGAGSEASAEAAGLDSVDLVIIAISGTAALPTVMAAARAGKRIALANKEALVAAGGLITAAAKESGAKLIPVDSEHSAIFQCLAGNRRKELKRVILTASGGPLLGAAKEKLARVTPAEVIKHPKWKMGKKISVDSATMMNKGLEVIEACRLFGLSPGQIEVVIHPQSIVHSMVEYIDGSHIAQLASPDMAVPISRALFYPGRCPDTKVPSIDFGAPFSLDFKPLDKERFPCFALALDALDKGGIMPCVLNAANEAAVRLFLEEKIPYTQIPELIRAAMDKYDTNVKQAYALNDIINIDAEVKEYTLKNTGFFL